jgi:hypothetical protein
MARTIMVVFRAVCDPQRFWNIQALTADSRGSVLPPSRRLGRAASGASSSLRVDLESTRGFAKIAPSALLRRLDLDQSRATAKSPTNSVSRSVGVEIA